MINADVSFINEPGDVITEQLVLHFGQNKRLDISNFVVSLTLHEDILSPVMYGDVLLEDAAGIVSGVQFGGNEYITIAYRTPTFQETITKSFYVTGLKNRAFMGTDKATMFSLTFVSIEAQRDNLVTVSRKFSGNTEGIVQQIYTDYLSVPRSLDSTDTTWLISTPTASMVTFLPTFWNPLRCINWATTRSHTSGNGAPNFLFFESNKAFFFTSVESLIQQQRDDGTIFAELIYFPGAAKIQNLSPAKFSYTKPELMKQYSMVRSINAFNLFDTLDAQDKGYYASTLIVKDFTLKAFNVFQQDYYTTHKKYHHLEDFAFSGDRIENLPEKNSQTFSVNAPRNPSSYVGMHTKQFKLHNDSTEPYIENWAQQRNSLMYELGAIKLHIELPGRTDIEVGKLINFLYPKNINKPTDMLTEDALDPYLSGLYLITAIRHNFSLNKHTMYVEIVKDSFAKSL
jgi:hypothetical protein